MNRIREAVQELISVFRSSRSKHEAHERSAPIVAQLTREPSFLTAVLADYLAEPENIARENYPVVGIEIASNPWFGLVANCWIPLPGRETHVSTKAIHHHGNMLLTTASLFGPGYEHWLFSKPRSIDAERGLYAMDLLEVAPHPKHHVAFVDAWLPHAPFYPKELSITLALWSNQFDTTWRDRVKRLPVVSKRSNELREFALKFGLRNTLDLKVVESFDFYPTPAGFQVMRERSEFQLGPVDDHIHSVMHVVQRTGNEHLGRVIRRHVTSGALRSAASTVTRLLSELDAGQPIEGKLSSMHFGFEHANFTRDDIFRALAVSRGNLERKSTDGGQFASAPSR
jgi:hypothetical protein